MPPAAADPSASSPAKAEASARPEKSPKPAKSPDADDLEAQEAPDADRGTGDDADASPSTANLGRIVDRLSAAGISTTADRLAALAADVGAGGAVRALRFAKASGKTPAEIVALFRSGKGWGMIARELNLDIGPGIGAVMGRGHGADKAGKAADKAARAAERAQRKAGSED